MSDIVRLIITKIRCLQFFLRAAFLGYIFQYRYKKIKSFCLFIGYPRTGHSLIASILDAHPNIVMGMEWNVLHYVNHRYSRNQIFWAIERNSHLYRVKCHNTWTNYNYRVKELYQGYSDEILVIGDKMAGLTSSIIIEDHLVLKRFEKLLSLPVKLLHVIRNPYDTITTMTLRVNSKKFPEKEITSLHLLPMIYRFFRYAQIIQKIKSENYYSLLDIYHESVIENPINELNRILDFLQLKATDSYYTNCSEIIFKEPHKSRSIINWTDELKTLVDGELKRYDFLKHYTFDN